MNRCTVYKNLQKDKGFKNLTEARKYAYRLVKEGYLMISIHTPNTIHSLYLENGEVWDISEFNLNPIRITANGTPAKR